jgi:hypothetical protein
MKVMILQGHQEWQRHSTIMIEFQIGFSALYVPQVTTRSTRLDIRLLLAIHLYDFCIIFPVQTFQLRQTTKVAYLSTHASLQRVHAHNRTETAVRPEKQNKVFEHQGRGYQISWCVPVCVRLVRHLPS